MSFVDSHCHINFPELAKNISDVLAQMRHNDVISALCISVNLADFPQVLALAEQYPNIYASVGVHPDYEGAEEPDVARLVGMAQHPKVIAIGETGLDYFRLKGDLEWQRARFRTHIRAARESGRPLIIHTREAAADTFAVRVTGDPEAWKGALRRLAEMNLAEVDPPPWVEWLLYSHPSIRHRLEAADRVGPRPRGP